VGKTADRATKIASQHQFLNEQNQGEKELTWEKVRRQTSLPYARSAHLRQRWKEKGKDTRTGGETITRPSKDRKKLEEKVTVYGTGRGTAPAQGPGRSAKILKGWPPSSKTKQGYDGSLKLSPREGKRE